MRIAMRPKPVVRNYGPVQPLISLIRTHTYASHVAFHNPNLTLDSNYYHKHYTPLLPSPQNS
jgi:hypothetical protein